VGVPVQRRSFARPSRSARRRPRRGGDPRRGPRGHRGREGGLEVTLDATGLGRLDESVRYLVGYPYGCLEQTTSRVVPMVALRELVRSLDPTSLGISRSRLDGFVETGIAKILRHQHQGGAFGLWPGSSPVAAPHGLRALRARARASGRLPGGPEGGQGGCRVAAPGRHAERAARGCRAALGSAGSQAFALHVLRRWGSPSRERRRGSTSSGRRCPCTARLSWPAPSARRHGGRGARPHRGNRRTVPAGAGPVAPARAGEDRLWYYMSSAPRTTAVALSAFPRRGPDASTDPASRRRAARRPRAGALVEHPGESVRARRARGLARARRGGGPPP